MEKAERITQIETLTDEEIENMSVEKLKGAFKRLQNITSKTIDFTNSLLKVDKNITVLAQMIELMAMQLAGCCVFDSEHYDENPLILGDKEEVFDYYYEKACRELEDAAEDTAEKGKE